MSAPDLATSLILVGSGAILTLGGTLLTDHLRGRRDMERDQEARKAEATDRRHAAGLVEAREIHDRLLTLAEKHTVAASDVKTSMAERALIEGVRNRYLLVPDVAVRDALANALIVVAGRESRQVEASDWQRSARAGAFVTAAYIRGEELPTEYVDRLRDLREKYAPAPADDGATK